MGVLTNVVQFYTGRLLCDDYDYKIISIFEETHPVLSNHIDEIVDDFEDFCELVTIQQSFHTRLGEKLEEYFETNAMKCKENIAPIPEKISALCTLYRTITGECLKKASQPNTRKKLEEINKKIDVLEQMVKDDDNYYIAEIVTTTTSTPTTIDEYMQEINHSKSQMEFHSQRIEAYEKIVFQLKLTKRKQLYKELANLTNELRIDPKVD